MDNCCAKLIQSMIFIINFVFALAGLVLIGVGAYIQINSAHYLEFVPTNYLNTPIVIIIVGLVIFAVAFFGCCGAWYENSCLIYTYAILLVVIFIAEIGAGIAALVLKGDLQQIVENKMSDGLVNYNKTEYDGMTQAWNLIQHDLHCCGVSNYTNWQKVPAFSDGKSVPDACCKKETKGCGMNFNMEDINTQGCLALVDDFVTGNIGIVGGAAGALIFLQLVTAIVSCCVARKIDKGYTIV